jgi:hypothetical protein
MRRTKPWFPGSLPFAIVLVAGIVGIDVLAGAAGGIPSSELNAATGPVMPRVVEFAAPDAIATATLPDSARTSVATGSASNDRTGGRVAREQQSGSGTSPHWRHMRTSTIDYRIVVGRYRLTARTAAQEWDWAASHFDKVIGGNAAEYKRRNPGILHFPYDTYWFTPVNSARAMEAWLTSNRYSVESAYLHRAGTAMLPANRITAKQFAGRDYWYYNPGDAGFRAWRKEQTARQIGRTNRVHRSDGLFFDTNSRSTVTKYVPARTLEFGSHAEYFTAFDSLLAAHREWVPAGYVMMNQSAYFNRPNEMELAGIAGGTMTEFVNGPYRDPKWAEVDALVEAGVVIEYGTAIKANHKGNARYGVTPGNYGTIKERVLMWEYVSYLMVVDPEHMDRVYFEPYLGSWDAPMSSVWLPAFERDIGLATGKRSSVLRGTDGAGQSYQVFQREFENALALIRPQGGKTEAGGFDYGDASAVTVELPGGTWRVLLADGALTGPVTRVDLRAGEAVIAVGQGT